MSRPGLAGKRVLVVEDEWLVAMTVNDVLTSAGCVVVGPFARLPEALAAAQTAAVDVALLDVNIAGEQVFPVAYALETRGVPFLFLTGYRKKVLPRDRPEWDACTKPFRSDELTQHLARTLKAD